MDKASASDETCSVFYAPYLRRRTNKRGGDVCYWIPPAKYAKCGWPYPGVRVTGTEIEIAGKCRKLYGELVAWRESIRVTPKQLLWRAAKRPAVPCLSSYTGNGGVYFIQCCGADKRIKIGFSADVENRFGTIAVGCPFEVQLLGYYRAPQEAERYLHWHFRFARISGEWFIPTVELLECAATFCTVLNARERNEKVIPRMRGELPRNEF